MPQTFTLVVPLSTLVTEVASDPRFNPTAPPDVLAAAVEQTAQKMRMAYLAVARRAHPERQIATSFEYDLERGVVVLTAQFVA